ncbi:MAG TPA: phosphate ABC transporter permease subunit PstC [Spirochaetia bacterium]|nr:MAG: phosphate ABC transporter permease subunit PstC [Spirochaetes bacterium GWB1_36_13]HCL56535.1 phosphate ABC transporter permease subunit PstC [Spirochaetia bacterium]
MQSKETKKVIVFDKIAAYIFKFSGILIIVILGLIVLFLFKESLPFFKEVNFFDFIAGTAWNPNAFEFDTYGALPLIVSTIIATVGAMAIAIPIGIGTAVFFSEYAKGRTSEILKFSVEILSSIPSVVIGFVGLVLIAPFIGKLTGQTNGLNALTGSILLALMALPTIISISADSIRDVPKSLREASLAMGASKWETISKIVIPAAKSGIMASFMLGTGRAIGETMTVLMVTGNSPALPTSFFDSIRTITATIAIELGEVAFGSTHFHGLFALGFVLFILSFGVNLIADRMINRRKI